MTHGKIEFEVLGMPSPQGSKRAFVVGGKARMTDMGSTKAVAWRDSVSATARDIAADVGKLDGPLALSVEFRFPMPASRKRAVREQGRAWKVTAPDIDKLLRCLCDGLSAGGLIADDARFCEIDATKVEVTTWTGAIVTLSEAGGFP
jgi:Holliday junction resolvase RusA-like endonuclease